MSYCRTSPAFSNSPLLPPNEGDADSGHVVQSSAAIHESRHSLSASDQHIVHHKCLNPCSFSCSHDILGSPGRKLKPSHRPFVADFSCMTWNARAFFARNGPKMNRRMNLLRSLASDLDFCWAPGNTFHARAVCGCPRRVSLTCPLLVSLLRTARRSSIRCLKTVPG